MPGVIGAIAGLVGGLAGAVGGAVSAISSFAGGFLGNWLVSSGIGLVFDAIGSLLGDKKRGLTVATRNPTAPWLVTYGSAKVGGRLVNIDSESL
jgi:hypothetical protein